jgi:hypothetical protein
MSPTFAINLSPASSPRAEATAAITAERRIGPVDLRSIPCTDARSEPGFGGRIGARLVSDGDPRSTSGGLAANVGADSEGGGASWNFVLSR